MISSISGGMGGMSATSISEMQARMFKKMDSNGDGKIDKDEMTSFQAEGPQQGAPPGAPSTDDLFSASDSDSDGALTKLEMEAGLSKLRQQMNENGLQSGSATDRSDEIFSQMDADGDGKVTQDEMAQFQAKGPQGGPPPGGPPPAGPPPGEGPDAEDMFSQLDSDQDGSISESEFKSGMEKLMSERSESTTKTSATEATDTSVSQLLTQAINGYMNGFSSYNAAEGGSGSLWSSYT